MGWFVGSVDFAAELADFVGVYWWGWWFCWFAESTGFVLAKAAGAG